MVTILPFTFPSLRRVTDFQDPPPDPPLEYGDEIFIPAQEKLPKDQERWHSNPQTPIEKLFNYLERWSDGEPHFLSKSFVSPLSRLASSFRSRLIVTRVVLSSETVKQVQESYQAALGEARTMAKYLPKSKIDNIEVKRKLTMENRALRQGK